MRRIRTATIVFLILLLLMSGCDSAGTQETTAPPETTSPAETTLPPETTVPTETEPFLPTAEEMIHNYDEWIQAGFVHVHGMLYLDQAGEVQWNGTPYFQYTGESSTIAFPDFGLKLTLPDEWKDHVSVVIQPGDADSLLTEILLFNKAVFEAQMEYALSGPEQTATRESVYGPYCDYSLKIKALSHEYFVVNQESVGGAIPTLIPTDPYEGIYVGEDENYVYWAILPGDEFYDNERYHIQRFLIEEIGEDAYNALVGDLVLDYDMVREMITVRSPEA